MDNFSSLLEALRQAGESVGVAWLLVGMVEFIVWIGLWRRGFRIRHLPDFFAAALARLRGLLKHD